MQKQGVVGADGSMLLPIEYDEIKPHDEVGLFLVKREALWGLLAYDGSIRAPIQYDQISDEDEPGVPWVVSQGERRGLIDAASGQMLLGLEYREIRVKPPFVLAAMESVAGSQDSLTWFALDLAGLPVPGVGPSLTRTSMMNCMWWGARQISVDLCRHIHLRKFLRLLLHTHWVRYGRMERWYDRAAHAKAKIDIADFLFAFFQNSYHFREWLEVTGDVTKDELDSLFKAHPELGICRDICNVTKHFSLSTPPPPNQRYEISFVYLGSV